MKCRFNANLTQADLIKHRLLAGMRDTSLSAELQLDEAVTLETVTTKMRAKETIEKQMKKEAQVAVIKSSSKPSAHKQPTVKRDCKYCGRSHPPCACPAFGKTCKICSKQNHFAVVCQQRTTKADKVTVEKQAEACDNFCIDTRNLQIHMIAYEKNMITVDGFSVDLGLDKEILDVSNKWFLELEVNSKVLSAKVDTGDQANVISQTELQRVLPGAAVVPSQTRLTAYSGHVLPVLGVTEVHAKYKQQSQTILFHVLESGFKARTLLGLPSIQRLGIINMVSVVSANLNLSRRISQVSVT